jgi:valyl-tRNA synthetase
MPFITEEIWHLIRERGENDSIMISPVPERGSWDADQLDAFDKVQQIITSVRNIRKDKEIPNKDELELKVNGEHADQYDPIIRKLANITSIEKISGKMENTLSFMVRTTEYYIPVGDLVDTEGEIRKLEEELEYTKGFLQSVMKKLNNERFVQNAPEKVVSLEKQKKEDAEQKIQTLRERIQSLRQ